MPPRSVAPDNMTPLMNALILDIRASFVEPNRWIIVAYESLELRKGFSARLR
jgi:hypothetical protein